MQLIIIFLSKLIIIRILIKMFLHEVSFLPNYFSSHNPSCNGVQQNLMNRRNFQVLLWNIFQSKIISRLLVTIFFFAALFWKILYVCSPLYVENHQTSAGRADFKRIMLFRVWKVCRTVTVWKKIPVGVNERNAKWVPHFFPSIGCYTHHSIKSGGGCEFVKCLLQTHVAENYEQVG
jgi:hypothetical protein